MLIVIILSAFALAESTPVINGHEVHKASKYPFITYLHLYEVRLENENKMIQYNVNCGGSLIARNVILSAAHCLINFVKEPTIDVRVGVTNITDPTRGQHATSVDYLIYEAYIDKSEEKYQQNDIALIWLNKKLSLSSKVKLAKLPHSALENIDDHQTMFIAGWGLTEEGYPSTKLRDGQLDIVPHRHCKRLHAPVEVSTTMLCARAPAKNIIQCFGDSGGPLTANGVVYGISSWTDAKNMVRDDGVEITTCDPKYPGIFTKVVDFIEWIDNNLSMGPPGTRIPSQTKQQQLPPPSYKKNGCTGCLVMGR